MATTATPWCGGEADKLYLQSGQFSSTMKTSLSVTGIDTFPTGIAWDGTNTPWCGYTADKLYLQSGQFGSTLKTSLAVGGGTTGISWDGTNTPWCEHDNDKLCLQSGQFSSTTKTSYDVTSVDISPSGISYDGTDTPWCGYGGPKLYLQSGQFSSTMKTSLDVNGVDTSNTGISWDGTNTPWIGRTDDKLYLQSGQFSSTLKTSLAIGAVETSPYGISTNDVNGRLGTGGGTTLTPDPAVMTLVAPAPAIEITLNPDAVAIPLVAPVPTIEINLGPDPVQMPLIAPAPTILLTLNPDPAVITLVAPDPQIGIALNPDPAVITLVAPNVTIDTGSGLVLTPDPAVITLVAPGIIITSGVPTPLTNYPEGRRTVVLYREASADSIEFADYCVSKLDVPHCNLCPLPNATANESLADYATFQTEVETDLAAWLALNPTVAANCSCFLIGYGVPGYFTSGGVKHSATSRLMNYGTAFSSQTTNPLYNPATVERLTKTALGGKYLASRIDADTLVNAKAIIDRSLVVAALSALPATDKLYSDDATYRALLACQRLRIITDGPAETISQDAFAFGDCDPTYYGDAGSRAAFVDDTANSADSLRSVSTECQKALANSYAAALGCSETAETFDAESFFEMLRIGGTLVEAFAVAIAKLDYTAVAVGSPIMTVAFALGGYNKYRGIDNGGRASIDWDNPVAYLRAGVGQADIDQADDTDFWYGLTAVSDSGVESTKKRTLQCKIESGTLGGPQPNALVFARVERTAAGKIKYSIQYAAAGAAGEATKIEFAECTGPGGAGADFASPIDTITISGNAFISGTLTPTWSHGETVYLACRAATTAGDGGPVTIPEGSPVVADTTGPEAREYIALTQD